MDARAASARAGTGSEGGPGRALAEVLDVTVQVVDRDAAHLLRHLARDHVVPASRAPIISTRILGRRAAPFSPFLIPDHVLHGFTPRS